MKISRIALFGSLIAVCAFAQAPQTPPKTPFKIGDMAPDFTLPNTMDAKPVKLSDFRGKKTVILAFFPAAFTGGCTREITTYQSGVDRFQGPDIQLLAISTDALPTLKHWSGELKASFPLLSDHDRIVSKEFGILLPSGYANRSTFVVDQQGVIQYIEEGSSAVDPSGAETACSRLKHKAQ
jgi:thioredoxin-dependent peroxiredoxin